MFKVLHVMGGACYGGISAVVLNYYRYIDRDKIRFDIAVTDKYIGRNAQYLRDMGCQILPVCLKSENRKLYTQQIKAILKDGKYDAIHVHGNDTSWYTLRIAKRMGVKMRVAHAHTAGHLGKDTLKFRVRQGVCRFLNRHYATNLISCGQKAGEFIYGKRGTKLPKHCILPNAINTVDFSFNQARRCQMRQTLGLENSFAIGIIGRLAPPKNTVRAVSIFAAIKKAIPAAKLVIVGSGPDEMATRDRVSSLGLTDDVIFLGQRNDVKDLYQALDLYMLTSRYEGFPVAAVEAMTTGLPCLLSDTITDELRFGTHVKYINLDDENGWVTAAMSVFHGIDRTVGKAEIIANKLDIADTAKQLEHIYLCSD